MISNLRVVAALLATVLWVAQAPAGLAQGHDHAAPADAAPTTAAPVAGVHMEGETFAAHLLIDPGQVGEAKAIAFVMDEALEPFEPRAVTLSLTGPGADAAPVAIPMTLTEDEAWEAEPIPLPVAGLWQVTLELQIPDAEATVLEGEVEILP